MEKIKRTRKEGGVEVKGPTKLFCQHCRSRQKGGLCTRTKEFVARKQAACAHLKPKRKNHEPKVKQSLPQVNESTGNSGQSEASDDAAAEG